ncbi:hypothetical protein [Bradyrhizobium sp. AS23.2]|uniref:hypothetical protein n=1 Tax=Bradyrhizobium sp. AS23.2 TaxID=1680155 RepID=UPI00093FEB14|nr:hypothetical protein [Bradyrhizobium sp. AS23.2]OKO69018.1 hypothetical protein AC630_37605 [Bradyrhizobium sp. AS23.2]
MQPTSRFDATMPLHLHALISDLQWRVQMLDADIQDEERKAGDADPTSLTYPILALTLRARRDNLRTSIAMLESRFARSSETILAA